MDNFGYDVLIAVISAFLGSVFGAIITKLLNSNTNNSAVNVDKQLSFTQIHIEEKKDNPVTKTVVVHNPQSGQSTSGGELLVIYLVGALFLIFGFLKYEYQIINILLATTILLESMFLTMSYIIIKNHCADFSVKGILAFNALSTMCVPALLYLVRNPLMMKHINKDSILSTISEKSIFSILTDTESFGFLLYQAVGIIILFGFILYILIGTIHVLAMINLSLKNRLTKMWRFLYVKTSAWCRSIKFYVGLGALLLIISFLMVSGILSEFLTKMS